MQKDEPKKIGKPRTTGLHLWHWGYSLLRCRPFIHGLITRGVLVRGKSEEEWRAQLTPEQYHIMREKGTEPPFTGTYLEEKTPGVYVCAACGNELFSSNSKYDSGTGWPAFTQPADNDRVRLVPDTALGLSRTEVVCNRCGAHLGHVFDDGPQPTGQRYCINSIALDLREK